MDSTPDLDTFQSSSLGEALLSVSVDGKIALAMKGRFFLRCFCENFDNQNLIGCAVTDAQSCLHYLKEQDFQLIKRNQMNEQEKIKRADFLINTDKSLTETKQDVLQIYQKVLGLLV